MLITCRDCHSCYISVALKNEFGRKFKGRKEKILLRAGKEILIKAVIQVIPTYMMSISVFRMASLTKSIISRRNFSGVLMVMGGKSTGTVGQIFVYQKATAVWVSRT